MVAIFRTGDGVKGKKNLCNYFICDDFCGAQTIGNIAVYGSAKQLVI